MTLINVLILLVGFAVVAFIAHWIIVNYLPEPAKTPALAIVGALLLIFLLLQFFPGAADYRIWR